MVVSVESLSPQLSSRFVFSSEPDVEVYVADTQLPVGYTGASVSEVFPTLYERLRRAGHAMLRTERPGHLLEPGALVNEAYLRLRDTEVLLQNSAHGFRLIAQTMRRVLIDHARAMTRYKRELPGPEELERLQQMPFEVGRTPIDTIDVERALEGLAQENEVAAEMLQLHWHFGVDALELASLYGVSEASVTRTLRFARAWLSDFSRRQSARAPQFECALRTEHATAVN